MPVVSWTISGHWSLGFENAPDSVNMRKSETSRWFSPKTAARAPSIRGPSPCTTVLSWLCRLPISMVSLSGEPIGHMIFAIPGVCCIAVRKMGAMAVAAAVPRVSASGKAMNASPAVNADRRSPRTTFDCLFGGSTVRIMSSITSPAAKAELTMAWYQLLKKKFIAIKSRQVSYRRLVIWEKPRPLIP